MPVPGLGDVDPSEFPEQANEIWKMLDDMAARDPREYKEFIAKQMREAQQMAAARKCDPSGSRTFTPSPGLVIKTRTERASDNDAREGSSFKLFLNLCGHRAVQPPTLPSGAAVVDAATGAEHPDAHRMASSLSVPLAVGHLRRIEASGACECVSNPMDLIAGVSCLTIVVDGVAIFRGRRWGWTGSGCGISPVGDPKGHE